MRALTCIAFAVATACSASEPPPAIYLVDEDAERTRTISSPGGYLELDIDSRLDMDCMADASVGNSPLDSTTSTVNFTFDKVCAKRFGQFTQGNIGRQFAVVWRDEAIAAPSIRAPILGGSGYIEVPSESYAREMVAAMMPGKTSEKAK